ncbi:MAG: prepilin-type N-terminal cleavage/methylation domain-containing protein [bacterium]|nr:prepilin-type N-terminal cleavage/methylation domain-containing protein [bacterium]
MLLGLRQTARLTNRGFTLVELLVVVSIIALLISILLPSLKQARVQAQAVACAANERSIVLGILTYQMDHRGYLPHNLWSEWDWGVPKRDLWFYKLFPTYLGNPAVLVCPGDPFQDQFDFEANFPSPSFPKRSNARAFSCGYGMNYVFRHWGEPESFNTERYAPSRPRNTILFAEVGPDDEIETAPLGSAMFRVGKPWRDGGRLVWDDGARAWYDAATWLTGRHAGKINMTSLDGAVHRVSTLTNLRSGARTTDSRGVAADCTFCNLPKYGAQWGWTQEYHYVFSHADLYWWTGPFPQYSR